MEITWYGYSCFRITERGHTSVVTDPCLPSTDLAQRALRADLVTISHEDAGQGVAEIRGETYVISAPGEYEIGELFVSGIPLHVEIGENDPVRRNIAYHFEYPNKLKILHLGALHQLPDQSVIEQLDEVHVLLLPLGSAALNGDGLADLISVIEPGFVVPMHPAAVQESAFESALDGFLKTMGVTQVEVQDTLRLAASALGEQTQVVRLQPAT